MARVGVMESELRLLQGPVGGVKCCWKFEGQRTEESI